MIDYPTYLDELILEAAARQVANDVVLVNLDQIHSERFADCPPTWLGTAATELARMGYGIDWQDTANLSFRITGGGLVRAAEIRKERVSRTIIGRIKTVSKSDWIAFAAFVISTAAYFKGQ